MSEEKEVLSVEEVQKVIVALGAGQKTFTDEDLDIVMKWAVEARISEALLHMVLKKQLHIAIHNGELMFSDPKALKFDAVSDLNN